MNAELGELYQELVLEHAKRPRNFRRLEGAPSARGVNPLCGDQFTVYVSVQAERIAEVSFEGSGCAISKASASLMTAAVKGRTRREVQALFERVHALLTRGPQGGVDSAELGKLAALAGVWEFPARVKCASLPWHALKAALGGGGTVSTEDEGAAP